MRILLLTESIPYPLDSGGRIKTFNTLRMLGGTHEVHCHAFIRNRGQRAHEDALRAVATSVTLHELPRNAAREARYAGAALATGVPYTVRRHFSRAVLRQIRRHFGELRCDVLYCDHLSMAEYGRRLGAPVILDTHNVEYQILRRYAQGLSPLSPARLLLEREWRVVREYERRAYARAGLVLAVSDVDAAEIRALAPTASVHDTGIAVDAAAVRPSDARVPRDVVFVGGLHWPPNVEALEFFLRDVWPLVRQVRPDARMTIVGRDDHALARRSPAPPGVTFAGYVRDIEPIYRHTAVIVAPLQSGSGLRVKILEAMARALPVVSTTVGCEGIGAQAERDILVADDAPGFAAHVIRLLGDEALAGRLGAAGRRLVEQQFSLEAVGARTLRAISTFGRQ